MALFSNVKVEEEIWKDIAGFEGLYQVSDLGRVRSLDRITSDGKHVKGKLISALGNTYLGVNLWKDGQSHNMSLHRVVAEAFLPNPDNLPEVNHKDCNPKNNRLDNLEWISRSGNSLHRLSNGIASTHSKEVKCLETKEIFKSITAAGRFVSASTQQVIDSINTGSCCKGYTFVYVDATPENPEEYMQQAHAKYQNFHKRPNMKNARKVKIVETDQEFDSIASAARFLNCDTATVSNRIKANKSFNGMTLQFVE